MCMGPGWVGSVALIFMEKSAGSRKRSVGMRSDGGEGRRVLERAVRTQSLREGKACGFCAVCERRKEVGALAAANVKRRRPRKVSIRASLCYDRRAGQVTR